MTAIPCPVCHYGTDNGLLCRVCRNRLTATLDELVELWPELRTTLTRQSQAGTGNGGRGAEHPLPFEFTASWVFDDVTNTITTWMRDLDAGDLWLPVGFVVDAAGVCSNRPQEIYSPGGNMTAWCDWLLARMPRIRAHLAVEQLVDEISYAVSTVRRAVDRPADQEYVCPCDLCGKGIFAPVGAEITSCRTCRANAETDTDPASATFGEVIGYVPEYGVADEKQRRLDVLRSQLLTEADVLTAIGALTGVAVKPKTFRSWIDRGKLTGSACRVSDRAALFEVAACLTLAAAISWPRTPKAAA